MRVLLQANVAQTTPPKRSDRTRGFVVPESDQGASTSSLDAAVDRAARFGHNFSHLAPPGSGRALPGADSSGPVQAKTEVGGVIQCNGDKDKKKPWIMDKIGFGTGLTGLFGTGLGLMKKSPRLVKGGLGLSIFSGLAGLWQSMGSEGRGNLYDSVQKLTRPEPHTGLGEYDMPLDPSTGKPLRHPSMYEFSTNIKDPYPNLSSLYEKKEKEKD